MTMSVRKYDAKLCDCGFCVLIPNDICKILHGFWVYCVSVLAIICEAFCIWELQTKILVILGALQMGGKRKRVEPGSCIEWMKKEEVWEILRRGNFTGFMERLNGSNPTITQ